MFVSSEILFKESFGQICRSRSCYSDSADIWRLRRQWKDEYERLNSEFVSGKFRFGIRTQVTLSGGRDVEITDARDALAEKVLTRILKIVLKPVLSQGCFHPADRGGIKASIREVIQALPAASSLSPLMGAFYLRELDEKAEKLPVFYVRYMDDILMMAKKRWHLKNGIRLVNQEFAALKLAKHPDKTFIGRTEKEFDFLGYRFCAGKEIAVSEKTQANFLKKAQEIGEKEPPGTRKQRVDEYTLRWIRWAKAGLK